MLIYMLIYIYIYMYMYIHIYIYIYSESRCIVRQAVTLQRDVMAHRVARCSAMRPAW